MTQPPTAFSDALSFQSRACLAMGSPFTAGLLQRFAAGTLATPAPILDQWSDATRDDLLAGAVPLRLAGALHELTLTNAAPDLAAQYPAERPATVWADLTDALRSALQIHEARIVDFCRSPPQTNEVRRCLCLIGGLLDMSERTGLPLRLFEIGASAGLNLNIDRYAYRMGDMDAFGPMDAAVVIDGEWRGPAPARTRPLTVVERAGCDISPIDPADPDQAVRLQAYVWPDQFERLTRLRSAIGLAVETRLKVERASAPDWIADRAQPTPGAATILFHSVMWQYMPPDVQAAAAAAIDGCAASATPESPFAWLRMEPDPDKPADPMGVWITRWPGGETRRLATVHPHGALVTWRGAD